mmetsp:Transcript_21841/g.54010  ORF Transcript_21841/g.54010 Transcript_21841/m.54010 type:complete len:278 (+) Transcript_21841:470-1303(+)
MQSDTSGRCGWQCHGQCQRVPTRENPLLPKWDGSWYDDSHVQPLLGQKTLDRDGFHSSCGCFLADFQVPILDWPNDRNTSHPREFQGIHRTVLPCDPSNGRCACVAWNQSCRRLYRSFDDHLVSDCGDADDFERVHPHLPDPTKRYPRRRRQSSPCGQHHPCTYRPYLRNNRSYLHLFVCFGCRKASKPCDAEWAPLVRLLLSFLVPRLVPQTILLLVVTEIVHSSTFVPVLYQQQHDSRHCQAFEADALLAFFVSEVAVLFVAGVSFLVGMMHSQR